MMYKNTFKLIFSNFSLVWKILAYLIISFLCVVGLIYACSLPMVNILQEKGVLPGIADLFNEFGTDFNVYKLLVAVVNTIESFCMIIVENISNLWIYVTLLMVIIVFVRPLICGFYKFATCNELYYYMSSNIKMGFTTSLFSTFKTNLKFQLCSILVNFPIDLGLIAFFYFVAKWLISSSGLLLIAPILLIALWCLLLALKVTLFAGWMPAIVAFDCRIWEGFKRGVKVVLRRFARTFSASILILMTLFVVNVVCSFSTFGAALVVTFPLSLVALLIFDMVVFYSSQGMRFYVDNINVVTPQKMEETDVLSNLKYII